jgi:metallo-beta-lactamase family protein
MLRTSNHARAAIVTLAGLPARTGGKDSPMTRNYPQILHHGAVHGTTGSCHELVVSDDSSILIDCGLFQGSDTSPYGASAANLAIDFDLKRVKALVLTHVHIDHVGRLPWLLAAGFDGPIFCSEPSAALLPIVLEDAFRMRFSRQPASVQRYIKLIESRLSPIPYRRWYPLFDGLDIRLQRAGHILGSAYIECRAGACRHADSGVTDSASAIKAKHHDGAATRTAAPTRIIFSGDLGAPHAPILPAPKSPWGCDILVLESTYGDRQHEDRRSRRNRLKKVLTRALEDQGTVLIPAFSIGRTQELLYELEDIIYRHADAEVAPGYTWKDLPIILDSPLASRFTAVYRQLTRFWEAEALKRVLAGRRPLAFDQLITVDRVDAHQRMVRHLADSARPAVVISGSGMCTGGRIVNYLKAMLHDPRHNILLVGYQAAGTPGRQIQQAGQGGGEVLLDGHRYVINARVDTLGGYSAHADRSGLIRFVSGMRQPPREIRIVHGDRDAKLSLRGALPGAWIP